MLAAFLTTVLFSISTISANRTARVMGGINANFWRLAFATVFLGLYAHLFGMGFRGSAILIFFSSGCIGFGMGDLAFFRALPRLGSRLTILLVHCLAAPIAAVTEWLWLGTTLTFWQAVCGATILAGVAVALNPGQHPHLTREDRWAGILFASLAAVGQALGAVLSRIGYDHARRAGQNIDGITAAYQRIVGGVLVVALVALANRPRGRTWRDSGQAGKRVWLWVLVNALAGPTLGVSAYQWALKTVPSGVVLPIVATTPLVIVPFARIMEGERAPARSLIGGMIAVIGAVALALVSRRS
jgi:drug/metabolite transporter (DMT)-like permease